MLLAYIMAGIAIAIYHRLNQPFFGGPMPIHWMAIIVIFWLPLLLLEMAVTLPPETVRGED